VKNSEGWFVEEYIGVSIVNAWLLTPDNIRRKWRRWNSLTQFMGFEFSPDFTEDGNYVGMKIHGVNPFSRLHRWWSIKRAVWRDNLPL